MLRAMFGGGPSKPRLSGDVEFCLDLRVKQSHEFAGS